MNDYIPFALVGFFVMLVFPLTFWWALSVAIIKRSRASVAATICVGLLGAASTVYAVWHTVDLGLVR